VAICARNKNRVEKTVEQIKAEGVQAVGISADVMIAEDIERVMKAIIDRWGTLHILINNVGGGGRWGSENIEETSERVWIEVYNKNALAAIRFSIKALPYMRKQKWGRIVTVTSLFGIEGGGRPWYNMAKAAETALMKNLALHPELIRDGITFNSVAPGCIMIPDTGWDYERKKNPEMFDKMVRQEYPLGRLGTPEEVANVIVFLCSNQAGLVNGVSIPVDGSETKRF
jgi:3-oxoacyl-[acyl-carrier protein] reductase